MIWPEIRDDLKIFDGYHSPQLSVDIRLNTNESPLPPPEQWIRELQQEISTIEWNRYPDRQAEELTSELADFYNVNPSNVVSANGSNEIIQSVLLAYGGTLRSMCIFEPTYALHSHIGKVTGTKVISAVRDGSFLCAEREREDILRKKPNLVFLCSPNNPTGVIEPKETISYFLDACSEIGSVLVVDEAYGEFADWSATELVNDDAPIVVSRTFSKAHGFAAGRLGYAIGAKRIIAGMKEVLLPYHLDAFKQLAGRTALKYRSEMSQRVDYLKSQRDEVFIELSNLPVKTWQSGANFILFKPENSISLTGYQIWEMLVNDSILVRDCSSWENLNDCLRVTIGTEQENNSFIQSLKAILDI